MKPLTKTICIVLLTLSAVTVYSQKKQSVRPVLFASFPTTLLCTEAQLGSFFTASKGQNINIVLANNFQLSGPVTSREAKYSNLQTVIVKLPAFDNSLFSLSKQTDQKDNTVYVGRILNPLYADGFELKRDASGNYQLIKFDLEKVLVNCSQ